MKLKLWLAPTFFLIFLAWIPNGSKTPIEEVVNSHSFFSSHNFNINVPGINSKKLDRAISRIFVEPQILKDQGYRLRFWLRQESNWFFSAKSIDDGTHLHLILRSDVVDEFEGGRSAKIYEDRLKFFFKKFREIESVKNSPVMLLIIPNKIFANMTAIGFEDGEAEAKKTMDVNASSLKITSEIAQRKVEELIRSWGQTTLSLIDFYKKIQSKRKIYPLYPYGESHWSRDLAYEVGPELVKQMMDAAKLNKDCYASAVSPQSEGPFEDYFGDIFEAYGPDANTDIGNKYKTRMVAYSPSRYAKPQERDICPVIYYVGTSYGKFLEGQGGIVESMQRAYRNKIVNFSLSGRGAVEPMEQFAMKPLSPNSIVLIEFPFRLLKE